MKKTIGICFFAAMLAAAGIVWEQFEKNEECKPDNRTEFSIENTERTVETESLEIAESMALPLQYAYVILERDGILVVYQGDGETEYFETNIRSRDLEEIWEKRLEEGIYFSNEQELYDFLESYSS